MKHVVTIARLLLGLGFVVFSANFFHPFLPQPVPPPDAIAFIVPFKSAGYLTLVKVIEMAVGLALLANVLVPLAITLLAPILIGILWFHASLEPSGLPVPAFLIVLELVVAWGYRSTFAPLFRVRAVPTT